MACPCCGSDAIKMERAPEQHNVCRRCGHDWKGARLHLQYYARSAGRSEGLELDAARKNKERLRALRPFLKEGASILEIGCAEGALAALVRKSVPVRYDGVEPSEDSRKAREHLGHLWPSIDAVPVRRTYDIITAFHVLEHMNNIGHAMSRIRRLLKIDGIVMLEVPNGSGNIRVPWDYNREHRHVFSAASLSCLIVRHNLCVREMRTGIYESAIYSDSLRAVCTPSLRRDERTRSLKERFRTLLGRTFIVYGVGGDYGSLIAPYIDPTGLTMVIDGSPMRIGTRVHGRMVQAPGELSVSRREKILIGSHRYQQDIERILLKMGIPRRRIVTLRDVFGA